MKIHHVGYYVQDIKKARNIFSMMGFLMRKVKRYMMRNGGLMSCFLQTVKIELN